MGTTTGFGIMKNAAVVVTTRKFKGEMRMMIVGNLWNNRMH